jgi:surface carbohydrate biosynthesis protein
MYKNLYLPIEIKKRELLPKLFLGLNALKKGFNVVIGDKIAIAHAVKFFGPGIYFYKSMNFNDTDHIKRIKNKNNIYVVHDEESGATHASKNTFKQFLNIRSSNENIQLIDRFYTWGKFDHSQWIERYKKQKSKFILTGSPRIDLCNKKIYNKFLRNEINDTKKKFNKFILFISSGISSDKELINIFKQDKFFFKYKDLKEKKDRKNQMQNLRMYFKSSVQMIQNLSNKFKGINFVIRPHPNENIKDWKKIFKKFKDNVFLDTSDSDITSMIIASKCVIHNSSFAGIQSALLKKPLIVYKPKKISIPKRSFPNKLGNIANSENRVFKLLHEILNVKKNVKKKNKINLLKARILIDKKQSASSKIIDDLSKFKVNSKKTNLIKLQLYSKYLFLKKFLKNKTDYNSMNNTKTIYTRRSMRDKLGRGIKKEQMLQYLKDAKKTDPSLKNISLEEFGPNGFYIYKN